MNQPAIKSSLHVTRDTCEDKTTILSKWILNQCWNAFVYLQWTKRNNGKTSAWLLFCRWTWVVVCVVLAASEFAYAKKTSSILFWFVPVLCVGVGVGGQTVIWISAPRRVSREGQSQTSISIYMFMVGNLNLVFTFNSSRVVSLW